MRIARYTPHCVVVRSSIGIHANNFRVTKTVSFFQIVAFRQGNSGLRMNDSGGARCAR